MLVNIFYDPKYFFFLFLKEKTFFFFFFLLGFHYDLNFMTIHGKSRYPGLFAWTKEGKKIAVRVPDGCLLIQAGENFLIKKKIKENKEEK